VAGGAEAWSQDLLVIRRNHLTGEISLDPLRWTLIPHWGKDPGGGRAPINAKCETVRNLPTFRDAGAGGRLSRVKNDQETEHGVCGQNRRAHCPLKLLPSSTH
jgi:hypothetical protein